MVRLNSLARSCISYRNSFHLWNTPKSPQNKHFGVPNPSPWLLDTKYFYEILVDNLKDKIIIDKTLIYGIEPNIIIVMMNNNL